MKHIKIFQTLRQKFLLKRNYGVSLTGKTELLNVFLYAAPLLIFLSSSVSL